MINIKLIKISSILTIIGNCLFIVLTSIAMLTYPGGTVNQTDLTKHYFLRNYFSDLGRITALNGANNRISRALFMSALILVGVVVFFYFVTLLPIFKEKKSTKWLSIFGTISGTVCAIAYIGVAIIPLDMQSVAHGTLVFISFTAVLIALILYVIAIFLTKNFSNFYAWIYILLGVILFGYLVILYGYNYVEIFRLEIVQVLGQRIVVYAEIITFLIQGIGTLILIQRDLKNKSNFLENIS